MSVVELGTLRQQLSSVFLGTTETVAGNLSTMSPCHGRGDSKLENNQLVYGQ